MKNSYLTAGMRAGPLLRLFARNHITYTPVILARMLFLVQSGIWSSLFSRIERTRYGSLPVLPYDDPVFIIGHWRTGSTFLHQLLNLDPHLTAPTLFQVALPEHFLISQSFYRPILSAFMDKTRPMDNVRIGMNEPQEDEYALFRLTSFSPLEQLIFPKENAYFLLKADFLPTPEKRHSYGEALRSFYRKIQFREQKQIVSKNPFNSFRIPFLADLFPRARFIHIVRHPFQVVPSTRHLWQIIQQQNRLNNNSYNPDIQEITRFLNETLSAVEQGFSELNDHRVTTVKYEDLESRPIDTIQQIYSILQMEFSDKFGEQLYLFLKEVKNYKKNAFHLTSAEKEMIAGIMKTHMDRFGYPKND